MIFTTTLCLLCILLVFLVHSNFYWLVPITLVLNFIVAFVGLVVAVASPIHAVFLSLIGVAAVGLVSPAPYVCVVGLIPIPYMAYTQPPWAEIQQLICPYITCQLLIGFHNVARWTSNKQESRRTQRDIAATHDGHRMKSPCIGQTALGYFSHELLTPINGIISNLQQLHTASLVEKKAVLIDAQVSGAILLHTVKNILDMVSINDGIVRVELSDINVTCAIEEAKETSQMLFSPKVKMEIFVDENLPNSLIIDNVKLQRILENIIFTVASFTTNEICIRAVKVDPLQMRIEVNGGLGVEMETNSQAQCLFICKALVESMGGKMDTAFSQGVFCVSIFLSYRETELLNTSNCSEYVKRPDTSNPGDSLVLVADDNLINQRVIERILDSIGCQCLVADNGEEAVELFSSYRDSTLLCVLMDCNMPVMDGFEATKCIRQLEGGEKIPIIAVTADTTNKERCYENGMDGYINKPVTEQSLRAELTRLGVLPYANGMQALSFASAIPHNLEFLPQHQFALENVL